MANIKINKLVSIESNPSNTILETMEQAGLLPEYNCRDGHCGACRCKLESGEVEYVGFAMLILSLMRYCLVFVRRNQTFHLAV